MKGIIAGCFLLSLLVVAAKSEDYHTIYECISDPIECGEMGAKMYIRGTVCCHKGHGISMVGDKDGKRKCACTSASLAYPKTPYPCSRQTRVCAISQFLNFKISAGGQCCGLDEDPQEDRLTGICQCVPRT